jgi:hypothetical protein
MYTQLFRIPNTLIYVFYLLGSQHGGGMAYNFVDAIMSLTGGSSGGNDDCNDVVA